MSLELIEIVEDKDIWPLIDRLVGDGHTEYSRYQFPAKTSSDKTRRKKVPVDLIRECLLYVRGEHYGE